MIGITEIVAYAIALGIAAAIPGPGMTALVARSVGGGPVAGFAMLGGLILGDLIYLTFAVFGLAIIAQNFSSLFILIRWFSIVYLLYLAWQFWQADRHDLHTPNTSRRDVLSAAVSGLAITLGNPKTIAFYLALLPLVLNLEDVTANTYISLLVPTTVIVLLVVGAVFILGALAVRRLLSGAAAQRRLHRGAAVAMAGAAGTMITRDW
ncbi:MAG: LysE family translocator [Gammaproteobacteria bacterium]|nr:LysE family translocator [Gammaproteobacteria bacterium]